MDSNNEEALIASMIDMYGDGPIANAVHDGIMPLLDATPYFDPEPGWLKEPDDNYPPQRMYGGVRERALWPARYRDTLPPCLAKVPLIIWKTDMKYIVAQHTNTKVNFSEIHAALIHFKFINNFQKISQTSVDTNYSISEKGLEERKAYLESLKLNPNLKLKNDKSVKYTGTNQLLELR